MKMTKKQFWQMRISSSWTRSEEHTFCDSVPAWKSSLRSSMTTEKYDTWYNGMVGDESYYTVINHGLIDFFT